MIENKSKMPLEFKVFHTLLGLLVFFSIASIPLEYQVLHLHCLQFNSNIILLPVIMLLFYGISTIYGFEYARQTIYTIIGYRIIYILFIKLAVWLPAADFWQKQQAFTQVMERDGGYILFSSLAFSVCLFFSAYNTYYANKALSKGVNLFFVMPLLCLLYVVLFNDFSFHDYSDYLMDNCSITLVMYYLLVIPSTLLIRKIKRFEDIQPVVQDISIFKFKTTSQVSTTSGSKHIFKYHHLIFALSVVFFIASKTVASKFITVSFITINVGGIVFSLAYLLSDVMTDVYGIARTRQMIYFMLFCNFLFVVLISLIEALPSELSNSYFPQVLTNQFRMFLASGSSFLIGMMVNSFAVSRLKRFQKIKKISLKKKFFFTVWLRFTMSTVVGVFIDVSIFTLIAFYAIVPHDKLFGIILYEDFYKVSYEFVLAPITVLLSIILKIKEKIDIYDDTNQYNILNLKITYTESSNKFSENYKGDPSD